MDLLLRSLIGNRQRDHVLAWITTVEAGGTVRAMALRRNVGVRGRSMMVLRMIVIAVRVNVQRRPAGGQSRHGDAKNKGDPPMHEGSLRRDAA
jgi:hypothetical protein